MSLNIGVFTLMDDVDCVSVATRIANFIADGSHSVALKEEIKKEDLFKTAKADFEADGTFVANSVHYYPNHYEKEITEDTIVTVFGEIDFLQEFDSSFTKLYLVSKGRVENKEIIDQYLIDVPEDIKKNIELILLGPSKEELSVFMKEYRCTSISEYHTNACPYNLSFRIASIFAERGLPVPVYHKNWSYDEISYHYVPEPEKQGLFNRFGFGKKKQKGQKPEPVVVPEEKEPEPVVSDVQVHEKKIVTDANEFTDTLELIDVPVPKPISVNKKPEPEQQEPEKEVLPEESEKEESIDIVTLGSKTEVPKEDTDIVSEDEPETEDAIEIETEPETITEDPEESSDKTPDEPAEEVITEPETEQTEPILQESKPEPEPLAPEIVETENQESDISTEVEVSDDPEPEKEEPEESQEPEKIDTATDIVPSVPVCEVPEKKKKKQGIFRFKKSQKPEPIDRLNIFVTGISHSVGTSYVAGSLASAITDIYDVDVWLDHKKTYSLPDNYMVHEVADEVDRYHAFKTGIIVQDKGIYDELDQMDQNDMMHSDMNVMVSTAEDSDLQKIAQFIEIQGELIANWMFVFNHVLDHQKKLLEAAMRDYAYIIVPFHDSAEVPEELCEEWKEAIEFFRN